MSERSGIEIDYCPTCRGVWLDRGELDKIIDRSLTESPAAAAPAAPQAPYRDDRRDRRDDRDDRRDEHRDGYRDGYRGDHYKKKRKESWLSELFD